MRRTSNKNERSKIRFNIMSVIVYVVGAILVLQLFNLQIIHGAEYRERSNTRLSRESTLQAARGSFLDRTGSTLATTTISTKLELYKTKIEDETLNDAILGLLSVLEKNGDKYIDNFPITLNPYKFTFSSEERISEFKEEFDIPENATPEEAFFKLKEKYKIKQEKPEEIRKILAVRYEISENGYSTTRPVIISKSISNASINEIGERGADFPGASMAQEPVRNYPLGSLASHILGYIGPISEEEYEARKNQGYEANDDIGKSGLEDVLEEYLRGQNGIKQIDMSVEGVATGEYVAQESVTGADVVLTIDANLQRITENALKSNIDKIRDGGFGTSYAAKGGVAVVMNVNSGEVLSMVSLPDFEPQQFIGGISVAKWNEYISGNSLFNRAVQGAYAPGSIFKMVTATAGLETEVISTTEEIYDSGIYPYGHEPRCWIYNDYGYGHYWLNVSDAIKKSCNYFFYEVGNRIGIEKLERYAKLFRLGQKTGIELPGEVSGTVAGVQSAADDNREWYLGDTLNAAIGQSDNNYTPIQIARYISILTNGQKIIKPTLIKSIINSNGSEVSKQEINQFVNKKLGLAEDKEEALTIKPQNIDAILEGMKSVTTETGGTANSIFRDFNIEVGGKTGSTESNTGDINAWFVGFAPYDNPEIAVVVLVENGGHGYYTSEVARDIIGEYFGMNINGVKEDMTATGYVEELRR